MENTYNGWRNHQTWRANLHLDAFMDDFIHSEEFDEILEKSGEQALINRAAELMIEYVEDLIEEQAPWTDLLIKDLLYGASWDIDYLQIAERHIMDEIQFRNLPQ